MSLGRRLERLERQYLQTQIQPIADEFGMDIEALIEECQRFFALSDAQQDEELKALLEDAHARGDEDTVRIVSEGWARLRSYR
jgi:hypothetical protein